MKVFAKGLLPEVLVSKWAPGSGRGRPTITEGGNLWHFQSTSDDAVSTILIKHIEGHTVTENKVSERTYPFTLAPFYALTRIQADNSMHRTQFRRARIPELNLMTSALLYSTQ